MKSTKFFYAFNRACIIDTGAHAAHGTMALEIDQADRACFF